MHVEPPWVIINLKRQFFRPNQNLTGAYINIQSFDSPISGMSLSVISIDRWQKNMKNNVENSDLDHNVD